MILVFFCKQKTAYELRISDWSSDVCSSDLLAERLLQPLHRGPVELEARCDDQLAVTAAASVVERKRLLVRIEARDCCLDARDAVGPQRRDRKSVVKGKRVAVRLVLDCRRTIKKNKEQ